MIFIYICFIITNMQSNLFLSRVLSIFTGSLFIATIGAYFSQYVPSGLFLVLIIIEFILIFAINGVRNNPTLAPIFLFLFTFISGLTVGPLIFVFIHANEGYIVMQALGITTFIFIILTLIVLFFKINLTHSKIGVFLFIALIGVIIAGVVNIFLGNPLLQFYISAAVVVIFSGYILYDISNIINNPNMTNEYVAALSLYLDFVNIFIALLEILGFLEGKN